MNSAPALTKVIYTNILIRMRLQQRHRKKMDFKEKASEKEKSHHEMIFTTTDAETLENMPENNKKFEELMFSDHELVQKSSENKRTAVSLNNRGFPILNPNIRK